MASANLALSWSDELSGWVGCVTGAKDPAQHETVIRRVLVGEAGRRLQGLGKLGITRLSTNSPQELQRELDHSSR